ncbi:formimidoylglutamase [Algoriphagus limi]|uniref:Formimidoylglutamase n=1 Tax=Algoriphagus limi TaxID=2975273 RepID=A0ABT2G3J6_9BACT|nr:formimidoylglutamase [Algoriphagus limi]MCS5489838.1 formimidoylglutamase [Algoriphagus limi]
MNPLHQNPDPQNWLGRKSEEKEYWYQWLENQSNLSFRNEPGKKIGVLGYPGEVGVRRNQGRPGTKDAPDLIRKFWGSSAYHLQMEILAIDYGNILTLNNDLESTHEKITESVHSLLVSQHFPILLGGGHDLAYAHGKGIFRYLIPKGEKLGIINLDAHFDLRPLVQGKGHSGSPFFQLAQEYPQNFHYLAWGIQEAANPKSLFETAKSVHAKFFTMEEIQSKSWDFLEQQLVGFMDSVNKIYLSIDLDGFSSAFAPGVSAPSPMGFSPELAFKVLELIAKSKKLISMDVVELNPRFDQDNATARLAARCIEFILRKNFG